MNRRSYSSTREHHAGEKVGILLSAQVFKSVVRSRDLSTQEKNLSCMENMKRDVPSSSCPTSWFSDRDLEGRAEMELSMDTMEYWRDGTEELLQLRFIRPVLRIPVTCFDF